MNLVATPDTTPTNTRSRSRILRGSLIATLITLAGCGGGPSDDPREAVLETVRAHQDAVLRGDGAAYCTRMTTEAKAEVVATVAALGGATSCEESAKRAFDIAGKDDLAKVEQSRDQMSVNDVTVNGTRATARLPASGRTIPLVRIGDDWLIADASAN